MREKCDGGRATEARDDRFLEQPLRIGRDLLIPNDRVRRRKRGDHMRVATVEVPEVMQVSVRQDDEATVP